MLSFLATAALAIGVLASTPQPSQWESDYGDALAATRSGNQPLLVVIDNPSDEKARINPDLLGEGDESKLLDSYGLCRVDASTKYGKAVAKAFRTEKFPYMAIIDKTGSVILYSKSGNIDNQAWKRALANHKSGERTSVRTVSHVSSYPPSESGGVIIEQPYGYGGSSNGSSCPSCQRRAM